MPDIESPDDVPTTHHLTTSPRTAKRSAHFIGLCGAGMSAVARILLDAGVSVTGSDDGFYDPIASVIRRYGISCAVGYRAENIPASVDGIVIGKHAKLVPETNPEVADALARAARGETRVLSFPEALAELIENRTRIVFAGSFGKSTCSALASWILLDSGKNPGWFVGADSPSLPENGRLADGFGAGSPFVLEGDEYPAANFDDRSKFLFYDPKFALVTSGAHDHVNVFPTHESYLAPFFELAENLPTDGVLAVCATGEKTDEIASRSRARVVRYARNSGPNIDWHAENIAPGFPTTFTLHYRGDAVAEISSPLLGAHNIENVVGVAALLIETGLATADEIARSVGRFRGVRRRLERLAPDAPIPLFNDFGSSDNKCRAGITTLRDAFPGRRLVVLFEPHTFSFRSRDALKWYDTLFFGADVVYVYQPPEHGSNTHDQLSQDEIVARARAAGFDARPVLSADDLLDKLATNFTPRDIYVFETSGAFDGAIPRVEAWIRSRDEREPSGVSDSQSPA